MPQPAGQESWWGRVGVMVGQGRGHVGAGGGQGATACRAGVMVGQGRGHGGAG